MRGTVPRRAAPLATLVSVTFSPGCSYGQVSHATAGPPYRRQGARGAGTASARAQCVGILNGEAVEQRQAAELRDRVRDPKATAGFSAGRLLPAAGLLIRESRNGISSGPGPSSGVARASSSLRQVSTLLSLRVCRKGVASLCSGAPG